jgi:myo-inositol-1(or 4)-monophosphatase
MEKYEYTDFDVDRFMSAALTLVEEAGQMIVAAIGKQKRVENKEANAHQGNSSTVLTETDTAVEELIISGLKKQFPDHRFIGEESSGDIKEYSNHPTWIIDPIDGTMNFVHSCPLVCTSVALAINRRVVLGIVNNPMTGHLYTAIRGRGAFLNGQTRLHTTGVQSLREAMVLMELPSGANEEKRSTAIENVTNLMKLAEAIRCPGRFTKVRTELFLSRTFLSRH